MQPPNNGNAPAAVITLRLRNLIQNNQKTGKRRGDGQNPNSDDDKSNSGWDERSAGTKTYHRSNSKSQQERQYCEQHSLLHRTLSQGLLNAS